MRETIYRVHTELETIEVMKDETMIRLKVGPVDLWLTEEERCELVDILQELS